MTTIEKVCVALILTLVWVIGLTILPKLRRLPWQQRRRQRRPRIIALTSHNPELDHLTTGRAVSKTFAKYAAGTAPTQTSSARENSSSGPTQRTIFAPATLAARSTTGAPAQALSSSWGRR